MDNLTVVTKLEEIEGVTKEHPRFFSSDWKAWLEDSRNIGIKCGNSIGLADYKSEGVYWIHFCCNDVKGREAIQLAKRMMVKLCSVTDIHHLIGPVYITNTRTRWFARQTGMTSLGLSETHVGMCELFYISKEQIDGIN